MAIKVTLSGKRWDIHLVERAANQSRGLCDHTVRKIVVDTGSSREEFIATLMHELLHAAGRQLDEGAVEELAVAAAVVLSSHRGDQDS